MALEPVEGDDAEPGPGDTGMGKVMETISRCFLGWRGTFSVVGRTPQGWVLPTAGQNRQLPGRHKVAGAIYVNIVSQSWSSSTPVNVCALSTLQPALPAPDLMCEWSASLSPSTLPHLSTLSRSSKL